MNEWITVQIVCEVSFVWGKGRKGLNSTMRREERTEERTDEREPAHCVEEKRKEGKARRSGRASLSDFSLERGDLTYM